MRDVSRLRPSERRLLMGYGPAVLISVAFLLMTLLAPTVAPERVIGGGGNSGPEAGGAASGGPVTPGGAAAGPGGVASGTAAAKGGGPGRAQSPPVSRRHPMPRPRPRDPNCRRRR